MKVLHVYKDYYPPVKGGIENHINLLARGLMSRGVDVQILVANTRNKFRIDRFNGVTVAMAPQWGRLYSAPLTPTFHLYLRKFGNTADIIHFHHPNPTAELAYFFSKLKKKLVVTYHSDIVRQGRLGKLYAPIRKIFLEASDTIIASSPNYIRTSCVLSRFQHKCTVIPYGIDRERFTSDGDLHRIEKIRKDHGGRPLVLFVGRFRYYKGLHVLIPAMKKVQAQLALIGAGPENSKLRKMVKNNHLNDKIHFLGELSDDEVNAYYKACDVFVLPSHLRSEAFGIVQLEAMCCGKPVVSTEIGTGTSFANIHRRTGITVPPNDADALADAINYILNHPEKKRSLGACGSQRVADLFTSQKMVESTLQVYERAMRNHQPFL